MKRTIAMPAVMICFVSALAAEGLPSGALKTRENSEYMSGRVVVKLMPAGQMEDLHVPLSELAVSAVRPMFPRPMVERNTTSVDLSRFYVLTYASPLDAFAVADELCRLPAVQYAEPSFIYPLSRDPLYTPNDPSLGTQYGLMKIQAPQAWDVTRGDTSVVIGIVDSGVEVDHPDLTGNIWRNPGENGLDGLGQDKRFNGVDDDANGYVDDWHGWDFGGADWVNVVPDNNPSPTGSNTEHGTHVAGIASASTDNGVGVAGTGFRCRLMAVKTAADNDTRGAGGVAYIIAGFEGVAYAAYMGADVMNCSWGGSGASQVEQELVNYATQLGTLVVAAAGNNASNLPFYPAAYENVLSVAATGQTDVRASFSNYGLTIDACAPGVSINSTIFPGTYTSSYSGTSMASPFAAGTAGLVKARFPGLSALQVGERVRVTADNIDGINPSYAGQLGKGRINAYRAVTESVPAVRARDLVVRDSTGGNNNGVPEPNETIDLVFTFTNFLSPTGNGSATISTTAAGLTVTVGNISLGVLGTLDTLRNTSTPFRVQIAPGVTPGLVATMKLTVTDGSYSDVQYFQVVINPTYQTHTVNQIGVTMTNNGRIGFNNFSTNTQGVGLTYPLGGNNHLFEGGVILGISATRLVDNIRNTGTGQDNDFLARQFYQMQTPGVISNQDGSTVYTDSTSPLANRLGVKVEQYSYAFSDPENDDFIIMRYDITNLTASAISGLYIGQFFDWDIATYGTNRTGFDPIRNLAYSWDQSTPTAPYLGVRALDGATGVRGLVNSGLTPDRTAKWNWISGGTAQATVGPGDIHSVVSSGPYAIAPGALQRVGFAVIGGSDLAAVQMHADFARAKWDEILALVPAPEGPAPVPAAFQLRQNYPNPFNGETRIGYRVSGLGSGDMVTLKVYDILGREVAVLVHERKSPGDYTVAFDANGVPSGVYLYSLHAGGKRESKKMMVLR